MNNSQQVYHSFGLSVKVGFLAKNLVEVEHLGEFFLLHLGKLMKATVLQLWTVIKVFLKSHLRLLFNRGYCSAGVVLWNG